MKGRLGGLGLDQTIRWNSDCRWTGAGELVQEWGLGGGRKDSKDAGYELRMTSAIGFP